MIYMVTRHPGATKWAEQKNILATHLKHLDLCCIKEGDIIIGTLPMNIVAAALRMGARYFHLSMRLTPKYRSRELGVDEMKKCGAKLIEYQVKECENVDHEGTLRNLIEEVSGS